MKKFIPILLVFLIAVSLFACTKNKTDTQSTANTTENTITETETEKKTSVTVCAVFDVEKENRKPVTVEEDDAKTITDMLARCKFSVNPLDNLNDAVITVDEKSYSYDSENGIFTYSDENTEINHELTASLSEADIFTLNNILSKYIKFGMGRLYGTDDETGVSKELTTTQSTEIPQEINYPPERLSPTPRANDGIPTYTAADGVYNNEPTTVIAPVIDTFIVEKVNGKTLTLCKYRIPDGRLKSGLWEGSYGKLSGSDDMKFEVGDIVSVEYDEMLAETYPYQMTILKIKKTGHE